MGALSNDVAVAPSQQEKLEEKAKDQADNSDHSNSINSIDLPQDDPHDIQERFVKNQYKDFPRALREIKNGKKETHWIWYVLPTPPYIVDGVEKGSPMNKKYALRSDEAVEAYLTFENEQGVDLRQNYVDMVKAIQKQMRKGKSLRNMLGDLDDVKAVSSMDLFARVAQQMGDSELALVCRETLELAEKEAKKRAKNSRNIPSLKKLLRIKKSKPLRHTFHF